MRPAPQVPPRARARRAARGAQRRSRPRSCRRRLAHRRVRRASEELDTAPLIALAASRGCRVYLPRIDRRRARRTMRFVRDDRAPAAINRLGIAEPRGLADARARWLDVVFLPLVGFDRSGVRLGSGGGLLRSRVRVPAAAQRRGTHRASSVWRTRFRQVDEHQRRRARRTDRCGGDRRGDRAMHYWLMKTEPTSFSVEDLGRRSASHHRLGRRAQLPGAQHAAGRDEAGRSGLSLLLEHRGARHRRRSCRS